MDDMQHLPGELKWVFEIGVFLAGLSIGSFLNVIIARVPEGLSIVRPASRCPRCEKPIAWYDNIPLLGWLLLRGRCRSCGLGISLRYPIVELLTGLLALALARRYGFDERVLLYFVFVALLIAISYIDLDHWIIPHALSWPGIIFALVTSNWNPDLRFSDSLIGFIAGFGVFALIGVIGTLLFKKEALGQGDWWLLGMIGAFLGWQALLPVILLASLQGTVVGLTLIVLGRSETGEAEGLEEETSGAQAESAEGLKAESAGASAGGSKPSAKEEAQTASPALQASGKPASAAEEEDEDWDDWVPPAHAIPFGPFLALAGLQVLFFGDWLWDAYQKAFGLV